MVENISSDTGNRVSGIAEGRHDNTSEESAFYTATQLLVQSGRLGVGRDREPVMIYAWESNGQRYTLSRGFQKDGAGKGRLNGYVALTAGPLSYELSPYVCYPAPDSLRDARESWARATAVDWICSEELELQAQAAVAARITGRLALTATE